MNAKIPSLGTTVRDYTAGLSLLRVILAFGVPVAVASGAAAFTRGNVALSLLTAIIFTIDAVAIYGVVRISTWLTSIYAAGYELVECRELFNAVNDEQSDEEEIKTSYSEFFSLPQETPSRRCLVSDDVLPWARPALERAAIQALSAVDKDLKNLRRGRAVLRARYSDRLGNRLFQYAWARLRAAHLGCDFEAPPLSGPWGVAQDGASPIALAVAAAAVTATTPLCLCAMADAASCAYSMDARALKAHDADLREWFRPALDYALAEAKGHVAATLQSLSLGDMAVEWGARDVAVHVRLGDILWGHHAAYRPLPLSFYRNALKAVAKRLMEGTVCGGGGARVNPNPNPKKGAKALSPSALHASAREVEPLPPLSRVLLISEDPSHPLLLRLAAALRETKLARTVEIAPRTTETADILALYTAPALILSISSFAWWPAFLSRSAHTVVVPRWGLLKPHAWEPAPSRAPGLTLWHDLTLRRVGAIEIDLDDLSCWGGNTSVAWDGLFD